jgi:HK97 family phage prohead protease
MPTDAAVMEYKSFPFECKTDEGNDGLFSGYAAAYAKDLQGDRIAPGAFGQTIVDKKGLVPILYNHNFDAPPLGFSTSLVEDMKGLLLSGQLITGTREGNDAYQMLKGAAAVGYRMGLSIGFTTSDWEWDDAAGVRQINQIDLWEVSLTPFPAQPKAFVSDVKTFRDFEKFLRDAGNFSRSDSKRILRLASELKQSSRGTPDGTNAHRFLRGLAAQTEKR